MANAGAGTLWNDPNLAGKLFTASDESTPLLSMIGGLNGGKLTGNQDFDCTQEYAHEALAQPSINETASLTAPTAITFVREPFRNTTQIFHEQVSLSYARLANQNRLQATEVSTSGYAYYDAANTNPIQSELDFQIATALKHVARDVEYTFINGVYAQATAANVAATTRGLMACAVAGSTTVAAGSAALSKTLLNQLFRTMYAAGATFTMPVIFVNAFQKQQISALYGYAPTDRNIGGVNVNVIETDFGKIGIALSKYMATSSLLVADVAYISPVFQNVPNKGNLFYEPLSKTGAGESGQIFGMIGLDHAAYWLHGSITGLTTS